MVDKIEEITQKIYNEGVSKANEDAEQIIAQARNKAEEIIHSAQSQGLNIIKEAKTQASEIKQKTEAELQLAARQFTSKLKQQITNIITTAQISYSVKKAFDDTEFVKQIILQITNNWNENATGNLDVILLLPEELKHELDVYFDSKAVDLLNKGVVVQYDKNVESGFKIGPADGSYILSFTHTDFENYFKSYLKDKTKKLLFEPLNKE